MAYDFNQVTSAYDTLTAKVKHDLDEQFNLGRLKGSDYANVYATLMNTVLQLSFQTPVNDAQVENVKAQTGLIYKQEQEVDSRIAENSYKTNYLLPAQKANIDKQTELYARQIKGFDENVKLKLFKAQIDAWSMIIAGIGFEQTPDGSYVNIPTAINNSNTTSLYNSIINGL